ncbi:hypothetical protein Pla52n_16400 [Stieleria varia]|uniref:Uncharacterized protein n=1 Tax=Stieleria varia TaxID=2528005 RepID=A0A5C6B5Z1_9BACT|nr:hypothetical protein Pla52n_16400 [Stieleria varia]
MEALPRENLRSASSGLDFGVSRFGVSHGCVTKTVANAKTAHLTNPRSKTGRCSSLEIVSRSAGRSLLIIGFPGRSLGTSGGDQREVSKRLTQIAFIVQPGGLVSA